MIYHARKLSAPRRGQALIEMALVVTILLFLSLGLIQFALLANARVTLTNLAREGARKAAVSTMTGNQTQAEAAIRAHVRQAAAQTPLSTIADSNIVITYPNGRASSQPVQVAVSYNMSSKFILPVTFPGLSRFGTSTTSTALMIIE